MLFRLMVSPDPSKVEVLQNYLILKSSNETKKFVAFANYYRKFVENFSHIWTEEYQRSFEILKKALINPPILQYPNFSPENTLILKTDASAYTVGAVLSNGDVKPIAYTSRSDLIYFLGNLSF